jgi:hypothetical protein
MENSIDGAVRGSVIHTLDPESGTMAGVCGLVSVWPTGGSPAKSLRANEN